MSKANFSWKFYKDYYLNPDYPINYHSRDSDSNEEVFKQINLGLFGHDWDLSLFESSLLKTEQVLEFQTTYPGLIIGGGYAHETGCKGEIKQGFHLDHSLGLPMIPGSSVKGVLKSAFAHEDYMKSLIKDRLGIEEEVNLKELSEEIFKGEGLGSMYEHDVFHDAHVTTLRPDGRLFGEDYITPHGDNPLKDPVPVLFMKMLSGTTLSFYFDLKDSQLYPNLFPVKNKLALFQWILSDLGVGAKTNLGYGHLNPVSKIQVAGQEPSEIDTGGREKPSENVKEAPIKPIPFDEARRHFSKKRADPIEARGTLVRRLGNSAEIEIRFASKKIMTKWQIPRPQRNSFPFAPGDELKFAITNIQKQGKTDYFVTIKDLAKFS